MARLSTSFLRQADWLNGQRVRGYALLVGLASLGLLIASWFQALGPDGSDFLAFWGSARAVLQGVPAAAYDLVRELAGSIGAAAGDAELVGLLPRRVLTTIPAPRWAELLAGAPV